MATNITFRTQLIGGLNDFCQQSALPIINTTINLVELIATLVRCQEEGVCLNPKVYLTNNIDSLTSMLPNSEVFNIGITSSNINGIRKAIKLGAPLARSDWMIFIENQNNELKYGVFKGSSNPLAVPLDEIIMDQNDQLVVIKAFKIAEDCIEIASNNGLMHHVYFNHEKDDKEPPLKHLDSLIKKMTSKVSDKLKEPVTGFLKKLLFEGLRQSHGCLIAVTNMNRTPKFLEKDGVILEKPIDFEDIVKKIRKDEVDERCLSNKVPLVQGMLNSDGITIFDNKARLLGYNCFVKVDMNEAVDGGARKRAFMALSNKINAGLCAIFMQSQDGQSVYKE